MGEWWDRLGLSQSLLMARILASVVSQQGVVLQGGVMTLGGLALAVEGFDRLDYTLRLQWLWKLYGGGEYR